MCATLIVYDLKLKRRELFNRISTHILTIICCMRNSYTPFMLITGALQLCPIHCTIYMLSLFCYFWHTHERTFSLLILLSLHVFKSHSTYNSGQVCYIYICMHTQKTINRDEEVREVFCKERDSDKNKRDAHQAA